MSSFHCFERLAPEMRQMIWDLALREETESRLVIVHRPTMRVMPHPSLKMTVMNACPESREYAKKHFHKVKLEVRTLVPAVLSIPYEIAAFASTPAAQRLDFVGKGFMNMYSGRYGQRKQVEFRYDFWRRHLLPKLHGHVTKLLQTPGPHMSAVAGDARSGICKGTIYLSPEHDRFALDRNASGSVCERAFLHDQLCLDYAPVLEQYERLVLARQHPRHSTRWHPDAEFHARHIADKLPESAMQTIRRVVSLHTGPGAGDTQRHVCEQHRLHDREWKLRSFGGAQQLHTARMYAVPADSGQGYQNLVEWKRVEGANGSVTFKCMCSNRHEESSNDHGPLNEYEAHMKEGI